MYGYYQTCFEARERQARREHEAAAERSARAARSRRRRRRIRIGEIAIAAGRRRIRLHAGG